MAEELADLQTDSASPGVVTSDAIGSAPEAVESGKPDKPLSIRDGLNAAIKEVGDKEQRARDEASGKFVKAAPEKVAVAPSSLKKEAPSSKEEAPPAPATQSKLAGPPPGWSQASKDYFTQLPADHPFRQDIEKRELEVSKGFKDYSDKTKQYQEIEQVLAPFRPVYQQYGLKSDAEATRRLFEWEASLRVNPAQGIARLAQQLGVDLSTLAQGSPQVDDIPEHLKPVLNQFGQLSQTVNSLQSELNSQRETRISEELSTFAKDHPHFETVRTSMGQLMNAGIAKDLKDAYDQAIWANPSLRDQILAEREEKRQADIARTQAEAAKNARLAAVSPPPKARQGAVNGSDKGAKNVRGSILNAINSLREDTRA